jgi:hypothetical protein
MPHQTIKQILMSRDNLTANQADNLIAEARQALQDCLEENDSEAAYNICEEYFGLEPDYLPELI